MGSRSDSGNTLQVVEKRRVATDVVTLTLAHADRRRLADWTPGAHLDLILPNGLTRQYSLCGDRWDAYTYTVAVRRDRSGRGGSAFIHDELRVGDEIQVGGPRNNFPMTPADRYLFIAGGIGITPIIPMIAQADIVGAQWRLLYLGHTLDSMPFVGELAPHRDHITTIASSTEGRVDLAEHMASVDDMTKVYACGPVSMLDELSSHASTWPAGKLRIERFTSIDPAPARTTPFELELARSQRVLTIAADVSIIDALSSAGVGVLTSCREGVCGTCETTVLAGQPDHRDAVLEPHERDAGDCMLVCVSRSRSDRLTLDI
ncbi:PDR/VanB family oxidoreductase [Gordonia sp. PKS22-38]|uniref:PDR/VanB family oxidoreductase n=1 Tax=Gordonia prachuapensis TaxID=3115651 RepID=A0ABU7MTH5_9ACTN|nr:PDR/VanB family oxidoreductase [Gordonia sp. PKS22-38]